MWRVDHSSVVERPKQERSREVGRVKRKSRNKKKIYKPYRGAVY
jgi:hypothetical protein